VVVPGSPLPVRLGSGLREQCELPTSKSLEAGGRRLLVGLMAVGLACVMKSKKVGLDGELKKAS